MEVYPKNLPHTPPQASGFEIQRAESAVRCASGGTHSDHAGLASQLHPAAQAPGVAPPSTSANGCCQGGVLIRIASTKPTRSSKARASAGVLINTPPGRGTWIS